MDCGERIGSIILTVRMGDLTELWIRVGYDDNGSSPYPYSETYRGTGPFSEPETETIRQYCNAHDFRLALNYHTYSNLLITPWGYKPEPTSDSVFYSEIASDIHSSIIILGAILQKLYMR